MTATKRYRPLSQEELDESLTRAWEEGFRAGFKYHTQLSDWGSRIGDPRPRPEPPQNPYGE